jgi:hypothetical protein
VSTGRVILRLVLYISLEFTFPLIPIGSFLLDLRVEPTRPM